MYECTDVIASLVAAAGRNTLARARTLLQGRLHKQTIPILEITPATTTGHGAAVYWAPQSLLTALRLIALLVVDCDG